MASQFAVAFSSFLVEYENLVSFHQRGNNLTNNFGAFYCGNTNGDGSVFVNQKDFFKFYCRAVFCFLHVVDEQFLASFCLELLALDFYNRVHFFM